MRGLAIATLLALAGPAAQTPTAPRAPTPPPTVNLTIADSSLQVPATFGSGVATLRLANRGRQPHQLQIVRIGSGREASEARAFLLANKSLPAWTTSYGGIGPAIAGQMASVTMVMQPGEFLLIDALLGPDGQPNFSHGLVGTISVTGDPVRDLPNIPAPAGFAVSDRVSRFGNLRRSGDTYLMIEGRSRTTALPRGEAVIRVEGQGSTHQVVLMRGAPEVMRAYAKWLTGRGPAPVGIVTGIPVLTNGTRAFLHTRLEVGSYMIFCPAVHRATGMRGFETGEFAQFVAR